MSTYFKKYIKTLGTLVNTINDDLLNEKDEDIKSTLQSFKNDTLQLVAIAFNNSAIEGKASKLPENIETHWWAGSGKEPEQTNP